MLRSLLPALVCLALGFGCSSHVQNVAKVRKAYYRGDLHTAESKIDTLLKKAPREADVLKLDKAMVLLGQGNPQQAEQLLRQVRDDFDQKEQKRIGEGALSMLTDDQRRSYPGEDYEKVLIRVMLALTNLMRGGDDAAAYSLQVNDKQRQIIQSFQGEDGKNPKLAYKQVAVGAYLHAALREETHLNYDDAARSLRQVCEWEPGFRMGQRDLQRVTSGRHSGPGNGVLYVFTLVGRGPVKVEKAEVPTTVALLVADRILSATGRHTLPPTIAPIKVPHVIVPRNVVQSAQVVVDGQVQGATETITDVGRMAKEQSDALLPYVVARAVARRVIKKAAIYGAKEALKPEKGDLTSLALNVAGVVWEATESADTRCWGLLPEKIQVMRVELPAGEHQLALQPLSGRGLPIGSTSNVKVQIDSGRNTYALAVLPDERPVGQILVSGYGN